MPRLIKFRNIASHTLVTQFLPERPVVIDAGANMGEFSSAIAREFGSRCFAIEPSPRIFAGIGDGGGVSKFQFALASVPGEVELHVGANSVATTLHRAKDGEYVASVRVPSRTLEEFCRTEGIGRIDVLKMDIEGEELAVLGSCSDAFLRDIGQVTVEFHEWIGQGTVADVQGIIARMRRLGFYDVNLGRTVYCDVLFINRRCLSRFEFGLAWMNLWIPRFAAAVARRLSGGAGRAGRAA